MLTRLLQIVLPLLAVACFSRLLVPGPWSSPSSSPMTQFEFNGAGGGGFEHLFEALFGGAGRPGGAGGGGGGGFQFNFGGNGMPFHGGQFGGGQRFPPGGAPDDDQSPRFINKALKAFGLTAQTDEGEVKRKYRKLAVKYHPDKCTGDTCEKKMVKVNRYKEALDKWLKSRGPQ
ncbi:hypothetical protein BC828DRAFT_37477 [Blastocladiella britannica]|nr:hypothetical protein BC828DRAFT_37477 [Blastocladiella britannica]